MHGRAALPSRNGRHREQCGNAGALDDLPRQLGQRLHGRNHGPRSEKRRLDADYDGFWTLIITIGIAEPAHSSAGSKKVSDNRTECRYAHTRFSSEPAVACGPIKAAACSCPGSAPVQSSNVRSDSTTSRFSSHGPQEYSGQRPIMFRSAANAAIGAIDHWANYSRFRLNRVMVAGQMTGGRLGQHRQPDGH